MTEPTFEELVEKFNIISNALAVDEFEYPQLEIKMRMNWGDHTSDFYASLNHVEIKNGRILNSAYGTGATPEEAMRDYYKKIVGKRYNAKLSPIKNNFINIIRDKRIINPAKAPIIPPFTQLRRLLQPINN